MKKHFFSTFCGLVLFSAAAFSQKPTETDANAATSQDGRSAKKQFQVTNNPQQDKVDQFDIVSMGSLTFTTSNTVDGSTNSFNHSQKITMQLFPAANKTGTYFLNFYAEDQNIPEAASYADGVLNIYYPLSMLQTIKESLEKALATKKKVQVKVTQKTTGYREGTLVF